MSDPIIYPGQFETKEKPPYWIGVFCIIPLLGGIVGLVVLILGIGKYRNTLFTAIGAAGILITVGIYGSLFYMGVHGGFSSGFKMLAQQQLNGLVADIEYYKLEHGSYPDSLKQLTENDGLVFISDPTQTDLRKHRSGTYYYEKRDSGYILLSAGKDCVPNTPDDLYPKVVVTPYTHIGLMKMDTVNAGQQ